jgi:hypothetical protein
MENEFKTSIFYRAFMTSVFVGIFATLLTMVYDLIFVEYMGFPLSAIINVASLIFAVNLVFLVVGLFYYYFISSFRKGDIVYMIVFVLLTLFCIWKAEAVHRSDDAAVNLQFRHLLSGIIIIMGILAVFVVPFLYHNKSFEKHVV